ncbi:heavy-metal-associated domain-containing protein [Halobacterium jilantaiense]|uniref:Heavy-metal-associated domain-containing protein n=1 Tax=Halobacterium jilantaiense TaxID=355548 RepID=A0A1I0PEN1_9EURY|nr:heavy metal-associated domain-containing protein [Halobacterium jilantaiense]SEW12636.1 Heavy-metal-associated domain-containing protein [Halobacterium jilantaiense]
MPQIGVEGMSCGHCEQTVEDALADVEGVTDATADNETGEVHYEGDADATEVAAAVEDAGYEPVI